MTLCWVIRTRGVSHNLSSKAFLGVPLPSMSSIDFYTFGGGLSRYRRSALRLRREAEMSGWFQKSMAWNPTSISPEFSSKHTSLFLNDVRGFGFWLWKPQLLSQALDESPTGFVCYADAGCTLNTESHEAGERLAQYIQMADQHDLVLMSMPEHLEKCWTKNDLMDRLNLDEAQRSSGQRIGTTLILKRSDTSREFVQRWLKLAIEDSFRFLDDSPSRTQNADCFRSHRHDQSILSCLSKA